MRDKEKIVNASYIYRHALDRRQMAWMNLPFMMLHRYLRDKYGSNSVLRNGPRILRAMNTVRREVEAQHGISED